MMTGFKTSTEVNEGTCANNVVNLFAMCLLFCFSTEGFLPFSELSCLHQNVAFE